MNEDITSSISSDISSYKTSEDISDEKKELVDDDYVDIDKGMVDDDDNDDDDNDVDYNDVDDNDDDDNDVDDNDVDDNDDDDKDIVADKDVDDKDIVADKDVDDKDDDILTPDDYILTDEIVENINVLYIRNIKDIINNNELFITHTNEQIFDGFNTLLDDGILAQGATKLHSEVMNTKLNTDNIYIYTKDVHKPLELSDIINKTISNNYKTSQKQKWILLNSIEQHEERNINLKIDKLYKIIHDKYIYPTRFLTNEFSHLSTYSYKLQYVTYVNDYETLMSRVLGSAFFKVEKEYSIDDDAEINLKDYIMPITSIN